MIFIYDDLTSPGSCEAGSFERFDLRKESCTKQMQLKSMIVDVDFVRKKSL